ncbi:hypothetical protein RUM44_002451 [Polyplax serrata]|uniref:Uncharacterized protein n=1 Tax=Polyplax serrata TaxID=468196 RepID=A0ABR1AEV0_POLSC
MGTSAKGKANLCRHNVQRVKILQFTFVSAKIELEAEEMNQTAIACGYHVLLERRYLEAGQDKIPEIAKGKQYGKVEKKRQVFRVLLGWRRREDEQVEDVEMTDKKSNCDKDNRRTQPKSVEKPQKIARELHPYRPLVSKNGHDV